jgi:16S rRNA (uracil1498-N3)-methyltransferase
MAGLAAARLRPTLPEALDTEDTRAREALSIPGPFLVRFVFQSLRVPLSLPYTFAMRIPRIFVPHPLQPGRDVDLPVQAGEHLARVLRLDRGHPLRLFNGDGREYAGEIAKLAKRAVSARVLELLPSCDRESPLRITLAQGIARGDKMDWILQKATELGVARIVPLVTDRTEVKLDAERAQKRVAHWQAVVASACEQCGRNQLPGISEPAKLHDWAARLGDEAGLRLALDPQGDARARALDIDGWVTLAVGPEGGLSGHDLAILAQAGFRGLRLGPRILRTETAGLTAMAALQAIHGDF